MLEFYLDWEADYMMLSQYKESWIFKKYIERLKLSDNYPLEQCTLGYVYWQNGYKKKQNIILMNIKE